MSELIYRKNGDYLLPDLGLTEAERKPLGKYGGMRQRYLEESRPGLYTRLLLSGNLMNHLTKEAGVTEELKAQNQMAWVGLMNNCKAQAEEMILSELIYA